MPLKGANATLLETPCSDLLLFCTSPAWIPRICDCLPGWRITSTSIEALENTALSHYAVIVIAFDGQFDAHTVETLRRREPSAVVLVISAGKLSSENELLALELGVDDYLSFDAMDGGFLGRSIAQAQARRRSRNHLPADDSFLKLITHNADGMVVVDVDGVVQFLNPAAETLLGVNAEDYTGEFFGLPSASDFTELTVVPHVAVDGEASPRIVEMRVTGINWQGAACHLISLRDVTIRHDTRLKMEHYAAELSRSNHELELFAHAASHDLQEPLRMVSSFCKLLEEHYHDAFDERGRKWLHFATGGASRMQGLIQDLLEYSRIHTRGEVFENRPLSSALDKALLNLQHSIREKQVAITHDALPTLLADHPQIARVFQNLVANAINHNDSRPPVIHIASKRVKNGWRISVKDNGPGIPPKQRSRIFNLFQRSRTTADGSGIGLAICQRIVKRHNGSIGVDSYLPGDSQAAAGDSNKGAEFWFILPLNAATDAR